MGAVLNFMSILIHKMLPRDIIAIIVIIGGLILVGSGIDHIVGGILVMVVAFYFGLNTPVDSIK